MIAIENLQVVHGCKLTLSIDRLKIEHGEKVCLIGKSGSGKTTLIECIFGLRTYTGSISADIGRISFSPQKSDLIPNFKVKTNILMGRFGGRSFFRNIASLNKADPKIDEILASVNIPDKKERYVKTLSGGEHQRVLIARAIYEDKDIFMLDEPTSALDIVNSLNIIEALLRYKAENTVICAIHNLSLLNFFQRVIILKDGKIILDDKVSNVDPREIGMYFDD